jgi:heavy metal translocating P-type ATPase
LADLKRASSARSSSKPQKSATCSKNACCTGEPSKIGGAESPANIEKDLTAHGTCKATASDAVKKDDDCSKRSCCGGPPEVVTKSSTVPEARCLDIKKTGCCAAPSAIIGIDHEPEVSVAKSACSSKTGCCVKITHAAAPAGHTTSGSGSYKESADSCCSADLDFAVTSQKIEICPSKKCCSETLSISATGREITAVEEPATKSCCADGLTSERHVNVVVKETAGNGKNCQKNTSKSTPVGAVSERGYCYSPIHEESPHGLQTSAHAPAARSEEVDLENGVFRVEHVVLSVQGMTCTGCEKKLYRSIDMLPAISNVKTSLLLAQAEFDLSVSSTSIDTVNTIKTIEKMTGFTCTKMTQSGHELDLTVDGLASEFTAKDLPAGVSDIAVLDTHTIRVTYQPKLVGARDLMSDPFFQSATLAPVADRPLIASGRAHVRLMLFKTIVSTVLTIPVLVMAWAPIPEHEAIYGAVSFVLATIVQVYIAGPWYISAFNALFFSRLIEMDLLVVLSTTTAYIYSIIAYAFLVSEKPLSTGSFFETSTLLVTLIMVGRLVSGFARQRAVESISIESLQSSTAVLTDPKTHEEREIDARLLQYQDIFKALPDASIATDGTVIAGTSEVDESMITGEATLVAKKPGSPVVAGSINHSGTLTIRLSRLPGENTIKAIGLMVDEAKSSKTKIQEMADRVATYFIPVILVVTVLVFAVWVAVGKVIRGYDATTTCINAMTYAISALIVSCPCAIGLAVPMVLVVAGGVAAKHGLIFKTAETIEIARNLSHVIFDKTGTLTQGLLAVEAEIYPTKQGDILGPMLLGLTNNSKHPVSTSIATHLKSSGVQPEKVEKVVSTAGSGIEASWNGSIVRAGNPHWLGVEDFPSVKETLLLGVSMFCVLVNRELVAVFGLKDLLRPDAIRVINELKKRSVEISIVSGDNQESVKSVASVLDVPESHVRFRCSPADKQMYVKQMLAPPKSVVMFCGDGTNDAVALAQASIGMHIDGGTDIAQSAADAVLVRPALSGIIILMDLSKAFFRRVVFNFSWSFIYNTFAILLAAGAFPNARIPPEFAGLGEIVSVLPVIVIGMQLKWAKFHQPE